MVVFPGCKINLGLYIERRRADGYHDIATVMLPVAWSDVLEIVPGNKAGVQLFSYGRKIDCPPEKNLVVKAWNKLSEKTGGLPPTEIHLEKIVPDGAGLGGGSADAAATLTLLNRLYGLGLSDKDLAATAAEIGADCPLFVYKRPMLATGTGTTLREVDISLSEYTLLIAKPRGCYISTAEAYSGVKPSGTAPDLMNILSGSVSSWRGILVNEFESGVFALAPEIAAIKRQMYLHGALYASMSGSGAAVYGLFDQRNKAEKLMKQLSNCDCYLQ